jgi:hypothetical protein
VTALLYRFVTERAAALKACNNCSGGWTWDVELGSEVFNDLIESMMGSADGIPLKRSGLLSRGLLEEARAWRKIETLVGMLGV